MVIDVKRLTWSRRELAEDLALLTRNPADFKGLERTLTVVPV